MSIDTPSPVSEEEQIDLTNEKTITHILEEGRPEELEKLRAFHNLTPKKVRLFSDFAKLWRKAKAVEQSGREKEERKAKNPRASEEELRAGVYKEGLEPQVRDAVFALRRKGYATFESGFGGYDR
jgi:hypothetical protein